MNTARRLLLSPRAVADLEEIADYIARDNPVRAISFITELEAKCRAVGETPELYPARSDLAPGLRMAVHHRYLVLYRELPDENTVRVERVLHSARNLPRLILGVVRKQPHHLVIPAESGNPAGGGGFSLSRE